MDKFSGGPAVELKKFLDQVKKIKDGIGCYLDFFEKFDKNKSLYDGIKGMEEFSLPMAGCLEKKETDQSHLQRGDLSDVMAEHTKEQTEASVATTGYKANEQI